MLHAIIKLEVPDDKIDAIANILAPVATSIRRLTGCIDSGLYRSLTHPNQILYEEHWENDQQLDSHLASDKYLDVLMAMEMASGEPVVKFHSVSHIYSMDRISQFRTA